MFRKPQSLTKIERNTLLLDKAIQAGKFNQAQTEQELLKRQEMVAQLRDLAARLTAYAELVSRAQQDMQPPRTPIIGLPQQMAKK